MNTPAHDTALYLVEQAVCAAFGTDCFVGREPLEPEESVTVYDTGGAAGPLIDVRTPTVQVRVRSADYNTGWQRLEAAHLALTEPVGVETAPDVLVGWWEASSDVAFIGRDDGDRAIFTANYVFHRATA